MLPLSFASPGGGLAVLAIGAHPDDIEIGAGGTLRALVRAGALASIRWVVLSAEGDRQAEARAGAAAFLDGGPQPDLIIGSFRDGYFPYEGGAVKTFVAGLAEGHHPDLVLCPRRLDLHQDHRLVGDLTWNTFRNHLVLEYEIPKYDGDLGQPNVFVKLTHEECEDKVSRILGAYPSQASKPWCTPDTFVGLARLRGIECRSEGGYAEAFEARKIVLTTKA